MRRFNPERTILDGVQAIGWGIAMSLADFRHKIITVVVAGQASSDVITFKVATSNQDEAPTFSNLAINTNRWDYDRIRNKNTGTLYTGDTGFSFSNSNTVEQFVLEDDNAKWLNINVTTYTDADVSGSISAYISTANDTE